MLRNRALLVGLVAMVLASLMLGSMPEYQPGIESHYHYRLAEQIGAGDLLPNPGKHLPLGPLAETHPVDHHWGLHVLIVPFTWLGDLYDDDYVGLKLGAIFFFVATILGFYFMLRQLGLKYSVALSLLPLGFETLCWRYLQLRGGGLMAVGLLFWAYSAFWARKPRQSTLAAYFLMIAYQGAFLMLPLSIAGAVGTLATRTSSLREAAKPVFWTVTGCLLGLCAGPYLWDSFSFLVFHLNTVFGDPSGYYQANHEFSPFTWSLVRSAPEYLVLALLICGALVVFVRNRSKMDPRIACFVFMAVALLFLTLRSLRMVEYAVPFGIVAVGLVLGARNYSISRIIQVALIVLCSFLIALRLAETVKEGQHGTPTEAYVAMAPLLEQQEGVIGNLFQADFSLILWAHGDARCVQGLNHYFVDEEVRRSLDNLKMKGVLHYQRATHKEATISALKLLVKRGVTLFTARPIRNNWPHPIVQFAQRNPGYLRPAFPESLKSKRWGDASISFVWAWHPGPLLKTK